MKLLSRPDADTLLSPLGLKIGEWNELSEIAPDSQPRVQTLVAPKVARDLYVASLWLTDWLPKGKWKLIQIDNSTSPSDDESFLFEQLINIPTRRWDVASQKTFKFELDENCETGQRVDVVISSVIFFALMFEWHIHLVSDGCLDGQRLALQDGDIYCFGSEESILAAKAIGERLSLHPSSTPKWIEEA